MASDALGLDGREPARQERGLEVAFPSETTREEIALAAFERLFLDHGLPGPGVPFASPNALFNLSKLAVWWLRLGIAIKRIKPGHPQQNGRHERMHLTLKKEATGPRA